MLGNIFVTPGNQIPGIPRHQVKGGVDYWFTPELKLGTDVILVSSQWFVSHLPIDQVRFSGTVR
jgi:iron complex outermembrane recepter protein